MEKPKIVIVSTFHMAGHKDMRGTNVEGILSDVRQREICTVVDRLKAFQATKIAVEAEKKNEEDLNEDYRLFLAGQLSLSHNERHQIGFRLAKELGHSKIHAVDWMEPGAGIRGVGEVMEYAQQKQPELYRHIMDCSNALTEHQQEQTIDGIFRALNTRSSIEKSMELYLNIARIGTDEDYYGMGWLLWWYQRNLIIFANLAELVSEPNERVLLLIGSSHNGILSGFLADSALFDVVCAADYL